jgi:hypothetical protein
MSAKYNVMSFETVQVGLSKCTIQSFPHSFTGFVTEATQRVPLVEQELLTLPEHLNLLSVFSGIRVARSLVFCVVFSRLLFVLLSFFFWQLYRLSSIYGF